MSRSGVAACALFFLLAATPPTKAEMAEAADAEVPLRWIAGLDANEAPSRGLVELAWPWLPGNSYTVLEDGVPIASTAGATFVVTPTGGIEHTYGVAIVEEFARRLEPLPMQEAPTNGTCEPTGVGMVRTPPFIRVVVHENCIPAAVPMQLPDLSGRAETANRAPISDGRVAQVAGAPR